MAKVRARILFDVSLRSEELELHPKSLDHPDTSATIHLMRYLKRVFAVLGLGMVAMAVFAAWKIGPRNILGMLRYDTRREGSLRVGDRAPDAVLRLPDGSGTTRISEHIGAKPLVLIFGSFT
jgi:hypothetical protein